MPLDLAEQVDKCVSRTFAPRPRRAVDGGDQPGHVVERRRSDGHRDARQRARTNEGFQVADLTAVRLRHQRADEVRERGSES